MGRKWLTGTCVCRGCGRGKDVVKRERVYVGVWAWEGCG